MKKANLKRTIILFTVLTITVVLLFSVGCKKEMPYNVLYEAKFVDKSEKYMTEEFKNELGDPCDFPDDKQLIINNEKELNRVYKSFPYEMNFTQDILVIFIFVDTNYSFECKLKDMYELENELIIKYYHGVEDNDGPLGSLPTHRCLAVKLTNCNYTNEQIKFK